MRFINTSTLEFEEVESHFDVAYAILSHRWGQDEVSYQDYLDGKKRDGPGYAKIVEFCRLARDNGFELVWADMCCIDKKSSAELSEAINSMFKWYYWSEVCYVYLVDVPPATEADEVTREEAFRRSAWWRRGWTLQELLAPNNVKFYDSGWNKLGTKQTLENSVVDVTGIAFNYLRDPREYADASIATRMSWASQRHTTRPEDIAYCLMGFFDVNMALLYGEGAEKAFVRLQLEIVKKSKDESIFAWGYDGIPRVSSTRGMLAPTPAAFISSQRVTTPENSHPFERKPFSMTNIGLKIRFPIYVDTNTPELCYVLLNCCSGACGMCSRHSRREHPTLQETAYGHQCLAVRLVPVVGTPNEWRRIDCSRPSLISVRKFEKSEKPMYVIQHNR